MAKDIYVDVYGRSYRIENELSSGGQGVVYTTEDKNILLKLEWDPITHEVIKDSSNNERYNEIRLLPILEKTNIILPDTILKEVSGYTMRLLDDMKSFEEVFSSYGKDIPQNKWLDNISDTQSKLAEELEQYISSGGIRKRLSAYMKAACVLAKLHATGLVYCDVSSKNMFVSKETDRDIVWLIDCDNLDFMSNVMNRNGFITPGYAAPEIYNNQGNTIYSDVFSFAIALFWTLTNKHPFMGEAVKTALEEYDMIDFSEEEFACKGGFAWIGDTEDDSNHSETGIPFDMLVSDYLLKCFKCTFSEEGRNIREKRTTMPEWGYFLAKSLDCIVHCSNCQMDYYGHSTSYCPWCDARNETIKIKTYKEKNKKLKKQWDFIHEQQVELINVPLRVIEGFGCDEIEENAFKIKCIDNKIEINEITTLYDFCLNDEKETFLLSSCEFIIDKNIKLSAKCKKNGIKYVIEIEV